MELRQLEYLVAVAEHGSFTLAAEALAVSQPSVSQGLRVLENELGVVLVDRLSSGAQLTAAGRALQPLAQAALRDVVAARSAVEAVRGLESGVLDLVCLPTLASTPTARLVGAFRVAHPGVVVRIAQPETVDDLLERIRDGRSELAVTELTSAVEGLTFRGLEVQDFVALVPADGAPATITPAALARLPLITSPPGTSTRRQLDELFALLGRAPTIRVETEHREAFVQLVAAGAGVAIVPRPLDPPAAASGVAVAELRPALRRRVGLVHRGMQLAPAARAFVDLALGEVERGSARPPARRRHPPPRRSS
ncbi:MAG TPA: LysR family transcriptional regulator [Acidimicrobiales bacterium]